MNGDRGQMADDWPMALIAMAAVVLIAGYVGFVVIDTATGPEMQQYVNESAEWCDEHGGELHNSQSFAHGGLHCELPNSTTVHMSEVVRYG